MDATNKEQIINKLEEVFNIAADRYIKTGGSVGNLKEIESLGSTILNHHKILIADLEKTKSYINATVRVAVEKKVGEAWKQESEGNA